MIVIGARPGAPGTRALLDLVATANIVVEPAEHALTQRAFDAWPRFGEGRRAPSSADAIGDAVPTVRRKTVACACALDEDDDSILLASPSMNPVSDLVRAITFPFKFVFVVGLCWVINTMTSTDEQWWHWVAFGMGIALVVKLARGLRAIVTTAGVAGVGYLVYRWWTKRSAQKSADANVVDV